MLHGQRGLLIKGESLGGANGIFDLFAKKLALDICR